MVNPAGAESEIRRGNWSCGRELIQNFTCIFGNITDNSAPLVGSQRAGFGLATCQRFPLTCYLSLFSYRKHPCG